MSFDFDAPEHRQKATGTPSIKVLNKAAAFFIADDNLAKVEWNDRSVGVPHKLETSNLDEDERPIFIDGISITSPRLLVMDESPLLVRNKKTKKFIGLYDKEEYNSVVEQPYRIYQVVMLNCDGLPLHKDALQLTATGNFGVNFNTQLEQFREECIFAYNKSKGLDTNGKRVVRWHSFWVFSPKLKPEKRGKEDASSFACITTGFTRPNSEKLSEVNIAMNPVLKEFTAKVAELQTLLNESWIQRVKKSQDSNFE